MTKNSRTAQDRFVSGPRLAAIGALLTFAAGASAQTVSQWPMSIGNVPGNLLLVPSVEYPTLDSVANLGEYNVARTYVGYFDALKCYKYSYSTNEPDRHFYPNSRTTSRICSGSGEWSGNYLNWAATQTIDPFRKALTGGYRVRDTASETWLEKARFDRKGSTSIYPNRRIPAATSSNPNTTDSSLVSGATPARNWGAVTVSIARLGNVMYFDSDGTFGIATDYNPAAHTLASGDTATYAVSVRVKVCDSSVGLEDNCRQYSQGAKPEGLIQQYSERMRYSVFGYLNDDTITRDGGVLRARQKFVGANQLDPTQGWIANANREWDPTTGVLVRNPDSADAADSSTRVGRSIDDSGVINYINKFGQMTAENHKSYDPVSELFYAAIRYLKNQGNIPAYTSLGGTADQNYILADGFPVIANWDDPMQYRCQKNALLGIGDTNTWHDKNLPDNSAALTNEPTTRAADGTVDVVAATAKVAQLEGITIGTPLHASRQNSAFMAGLAYDSHTKDMRPDLADTQTASTYWVDVREAGVLAGRATNPYWLATKYGGFKVPRNFDPYATTTTQLDNSWWASTDVLSTNDLRPKNFYVASEADKMVESLSRAFARFAGEAIASGSALTSNSTRLESDTQTFQALYDSTWSGELQAFTVNTNGTLASSPRWKATTGLNAATWSSRPIYFYNPQGNNASRYALFNWNNLGTNQQAALGTQQVVDYLRGDRTLEEERNNGLFRTRTEILGDIVNSTPVYVGKGNAVLYAGAAFSGASSYSSFIATTNSRTPVLYVGANDGMLHGFNASTGAETYAYVPNAAIMNNLRSFSDPAYDHRYFVDGELTVSDVYISGNWKTVLVGTMGRGGPGVFALDVTDPSSVQFLWEKNGTNIPALGKNLGRPVIAQVADGSWRVLLGNGPASTGGAAQLVMIDIEDGDVTVANTGVTGSNGLTAVLARDTNGDRFADVAYAGDLRGNLWKFSGLASTPGASKLFEARDPTGIEQPITAAPLAGKDPETGITWVFFGTGRYLGGNDPTDRQVQTWYGIKDTGASMATRSDLVQRDILAEGIINGTAVRVIEEGTAADLTSRQGWFMDLVSPGSVGAQGERMVLPNRFQGSVLLGTTLIPDSSDACQPSGRSFVMAINPFTGARLDHTFFDASLDGQFTVNDQLSGQTVSGVGFNPGLGGNPNFVENVMQGNLFNGTTVVMQTRGGAGEAGRLSWRELVN